MRSAGRERLPAWVVRIRFMLDLMIVSPDICRSCILAPRQARGSRKCRAASPELRSAHASLQSGLRALFQAYMDSRPEPPYTGVGGILISYETIWRKSRSNGA